MPRKDEMNMKLDKEDKKESVNEKITPEASNEAAPAKSSPPWLLIAMATFASVVTLVFMLLIIMMFVADHARQQGMRSYDSYSGHGGSSSYRQPDDNYGGYGKRFSADAARGVVTNIDGDTLTISGGGKQIKVKRTNDTIINGDKEDVSVNDTVIVIGQKDDEGIFTAKAIIIRNGTENVNRMPMGERPRF